jgi:hypothetical protein
MMSNYVIDVYLSSDPGTYMVRIGLPYKTGCDKYDKLKKTYNLLVLTLFSLFDFR